MYNFQKDRNKALRNVKEHIKKGFANAEELQQGTNFFHLLTLINALFPKNILDYKNNDAYCSYFLSKTSFDDPKANLHLHKSFLILDQILEGDFKAFYKKAFQEKVMYIHNLNTNLNRIDINLSGKFRGIIRHFATSIGYKTSEAGALFNQAALPLDAKPDLIDEGVSGEMKMGCPHRAVVDKELDALPLSITKWPLIIFKSAAKQ